MRRRDFLLASAAAAIGSTVATQGEASRIAVTFDDFNLFDVPALSAVSRNLAILDALRANDLKSAVFVIGRNVEGADKIRLLQLWNDAGHIVGNHTYSHRRYSRADFSEFTLDILKNDGMLKSLSQFRKWLRFPFLDEGATARMFKDKGWQLVDVQKAYEDPSLRAGSASAAGGPEPSVVSGQGHWPLRRCVALSR